MRAKAQQRWTREAHWVTRGGLALVALLLVAGPLVAQPTATPPSLGEKTSKAVIIPIDGDIDDVMLDSIKRRVEEAKQAGNDTLIFRVDTWGGLVTSAINISQLIQNQPRDIRTVAWVNHRAISAGAMISVGCSEIWMSRASRIGDCAPIAMGVSDMGETERAKIESPVLQVFRDAATRHGYPVELMEAMVQIGREVWWLEKIDPNDPNTPERRFVYTEEKEKLLGEKADEDKSTLQRLLPSAAKDNEWKLVEAVPNPLQDAAESMLPVRQPVDPANELLTLSQSEAVAYGLAKGIASSQTALEQALGTTITKVYEISGWERFVMWLNYPSIRGVFFIIMLLGAYIEFQSPGLILPGTVGLVAAIIFFGAPYAAGMADIWTFILLGIGLVLLIIEIFVLPGFGIFGFLGIAFILVSLIGTFVQSEPTIPGGGGWIPLPTLQGTWDGIKTGIMVLSLGTIGTIVGLVALASIFPRIPATQHLVPGNPEAIDLPIRDAHPDAALVGDVGVVEGELKPWGLARFGNEVVDVTTQGRYVDVGTKVQVIERSGPRIVVRPLPEEA